jgi:hypothetical protein
MLREHDKQLKKEGKQSNYSELLYTCVYCSVCSKPTANQMFARALSLSLSLSLSFSLCVDSRSTEPLIVADLGRRSKLNMDAPDAMAQRAEAERLAREIEVGSSQMWLG